MSSLSWRLSRLSCMSARELIHRLGVEWRRRLTSRARAHRSPFARSAPTVERFRRSHANRFFPLREAADRLASAERDRILSSARQILDHRVPLLGACEVDLREPVQWRRCPRTGRLADLTPAGRLDALDMGACGDIKYLWELNRQQHLVTLGQAFLLTGRDRFARTAVEHMLGWIEQNPPGLGPNWICPLEASLRLLSWTWALEAVHPSDALDTPGLRRILAGMHAQTAFVADGLSLFSSANNHLVGQAAALATVGMVFVELQGSRHWARIGRRLLRRELLRQVAPDGVGREQATGYHAFTFELFLGGLLLARRYGADPGPEAWGRLDRMLEFLAAMTDGASDAFRIGDEDGGRGLALGGPGPRDMRRLVALGAAALDRPDLAVDGGGEAAWLLGRRAERATVPWRRPAARPGSRLFPDGGYAVLSSGHDEARTRVTAVVDVGDLGYPATAAHGHADALSVCVRVDGLDLLVDPGTGSYHGSRRWRDYFRSTGAHNTVRVDGRDQSAPAGTFLYGPRARTRLESWFEHDGRVRVAASHDGYLRLAGAVRHRRQVDLDRATGVLTVDDWLLARAGRHQVEQFWHLHPDCGLRRLDAHTVEIHREHVRLRLAFDPRLDVTVRRASLDPIAGWHSPAYGRRIATQTLQAACPSSGRRLHLRTTIQPVHAQGQPLPAARYA